MAIAIENTIQLWRGRIQSGPAGRFLHWWTEELRAALPEPLQQKLEHARRRLVISFDQQEVVLAVEEHKTISELRRFVPDPDAPFQKQQLADLLVENELDEVPRFLLLDMSEVLNKELVLPAATIPNLEQVLTFEMDRHTPFKAQDVYFSWLVDDQQRNEDQIRVQLFVTPRALVDQACKRLDELNLGPSGVDVLVDSRTQRLNLLPANRRARIINRKTRLNRYLSLAGIALMAVTMFVSLSLRTHKIEALQEAISAVRDEALSVQKIRDQIKDTSEAAGFLTQHRAQSPLAVELLSELTRALPDDTYLDRLVISPTSVQMQGKSKNAQQLIEVVNDSSLLTSASFRGSTRLDTRSGLEIFEINADIIDAIGLSSEGGQ